MTITKASARRSRTKLIASILTTHGYAVLGVAIVQPLLSGAPKFSVFHMLGGILGVAMQAVAVYLAPYGE
jgi:hypothetical protein